MSSSELKCPHCPVTRPSRSRLQYHIDSAHPNGGALGPGHGRSLKCPYCAGTRMSRMSLKNHVDQHHQGADTAERRAEAVKAARWVEDVVEELPTAAPDVVPDEYGTQGSTSPVCICGDVIQLLDPEDPTSWIHAPGSNTPCLDAIPAKRTLAAQGRTDLSQKLADTGKRLDKAGREIKELKDQADAVLARLEALDHASMEPAVVRRATLNQVWDKLMDAGNVTGAQLVMRMIGGIHEGDWT